MKLTELLKPLPEDWIIRRLAGNPDIEEITCDSRKVSEGSLFFAIRGMVADGLEFVPEAVKKGASAVISTEPPVSQIDLPWVQVVSIRKVMAECAARIYGYPAEKINLTGITGTNGKTTVAYILDSILSLESPSLLLGTIRTSIGGFHEDAGLTTPESTDLQRILARAVRKGIRNGVMEVSSHALAFDRVHGIGFPTAVFTNLTVDHLDFHKDLEDYFSAKYRLFDPASNQSLQQAVVNTDDPFGLRLAGTSPARIISYGLDASSDVHPVEMESGIDGISLELNSPWGRFKISSALCGKHNVYNIMAAFSAAMAEGVSPEIVREGINSLKAVPGRFQKLDLDLPYSVILDYAHTPDALENVLDLSRSVCKKRVISVFGCGGDRDPGKRPQMAKIGIAGSDHAILTSDNPRTENPEKILEDMKKGITGEIQSREWEIIVDRKAAIARALDLAGNGDLVLLAGKGHEDYQVLGSEKVPFDEEQIVKEILCSR